MRKGIPKIRYSRIDAFLKRIKKALRKHWKKAIPYILFGYFGNKLAYSFRITTDKNFWMRLVKSIGSLEEAFSSILPSFNGYDLRGGIATGMLAWFIVWYKRKNAKKFRYGYEYGSAKWSNANDIEPYMDAENPDNNIVLTMTEMIRLIGKSIKPRFDKNTNVLKIGGSR